VHVDHVPLTRVHIVANLTIYTSQTMNREADDFVASSRLVARCSDYITTSGDRWRFITV